MKPVAMTSEQRNGNNRLQMDYMDLTDNGLELFNYDRGKDIITIF
jgi:hypothetical protein